MPQISAAGHALEYAWIEGSRPTLVFLHEGLGSMRQWRDFPEQVARATGCRALVYDRYGYGNSDVLREARVGVEFMHDAALNELPELLENLNVENPVLVGHSDGASIALIHAGTYPVRGVAAMAPHVFVEEVCVHSIQEAARQFETTDLPKRLAKYHRNSRTTLHLGTNAWLDPAFRARPGAANCGKAAAGSASRSRVGTSTLVTSAYRIALTARRSVSAVPG